MSKNPYNRWLRTDISFYSLLVGRNPKKGEYGIEIEVEGENLPHNIPGWVEHPDGSLRGESTEYIFDGPVTLKGSVERLDKIEEAFKSSGGKIIPSYRASSHIHVNVSDLPLVKIANFITTYFILEDLLFDFAGRERAGNLFCLRGSDAEGLIYSLSQAVRTGDMVNWLNNDQIRYSALNVKALIQHGSLEVRGMRSTDDFNEVKQWLRIVHQLRQSVNSFRDPQDVIVSISARGAEGFIRSIFDEDTANLFVKSRNLYQRMIDGARLIQDFAYCIPDWEHVKEDRAAQPIPVPLDDALADFVRIVNAQQPAQPIRARPMRQVNNNWMIQDINANAVEEENDDF